MSQTSPSVSSPSSASAGFAKHRLLYCARFLPFDLPSRKDSDLAFVLNSVPYVVTGALLLAVASVVIPGERQLTVMWYSNLASLPDWFEKVLNGLITIAFLCAIAYSIGVLLIEKGRRYYRQYIIRSIERLVVHFVSQPPDYHELSSN